MNENKHPYQALLAEMQLAINSFVLILPSELRQNAQNKHDSLVVDLSVSENEIRSYLAEIGRQEYPYRHAFWDCTGNRKTEILQKQLQPKLSGSLADSVQKYLTNGGKIEKYPNSEAFVLLSGEDRANFESAYLEAKKETNIILASLISIDSPEFKAALNEWENKAKQIETILSEILVMKDDNSKWTAQIIDRVGRLKAGFAITEKDPEIKEVQEELLYWKGTLHPDDV